MEIKNIGKHLWEIEKSGNMRVVGLVFASENILEAIKKDKTLGQVKNVASLPGILNYSIALSDAHQGYGFPIGGVAAFDLERGIVSPGGVGYDINCSVRLVTTNLTKKEVAKKKDALLRALYKAVPSGVGRGSTFNISKKELLELLKGGAQYLVKKGYGKKEDYLHTEEEGCMKDADPSKVSERALKRGIGQVGTLGAGNHFLEVQFVDEVFDKKAAKVFGLEKGQIVVMIHCGSRGLGHQVASDYIKKMEHEYGVNHLSDRELINAPIQSALGKDYLKAMAAAANFAFANKQMITHRVRAVFKELFATSNVEVLYDVCHNIAKIEDHVVDAKLKKVCVHRKGATRSFGPGSKDLPKEYKKIGQPVIIPGSMGTASYVLVGTKKAHDISFGSTVHGAGRLKSRSSAMRELQGANVKKDLQKIGIDISSDNIKALAQEAPQAYKDIDDVVNTVDEIGISKKVARLKPFLVIKG